MNFCSKISACTLCQHNYNSQLPSSPHNQQEKPCRIPLNLFCGHSCCYECVIQRKEDQKSVSIVSCKVCDSVNSFNLSLLKSNLPSFINCTQLGYIHLKEIEPHFRDSLEDHGTLYTPVRADEAAKTDFGASVCTLHDHLPLDYWCIEHKVAICSRCRLSNHLRHDVIFAKDRHFKELEEREKSISKAIQLLDRLQQAKEAVADKHCELEAEYNKSSNMVRQKFADFHGIVQAHEMEVEQKLDRIRTECSKPLRDAMDVVISQRTAIQAPGVDRESVLRCTQLMEKLQDSLPALNSLPSAHTEMSNKILIDSQLYLGSIRILADGLLLSVQEKGNPISDEWLQLETLFRELSCNKAQPLQREVQQPEKPSEEIHPPDIVNQARNFKRGMVVEAQISISDAVDQFYVILQPSNNSESLANLQSMMNFQSTKRRTLTGVQPGQLLAFRSRDGGWSRVLVEDVNLSCDDVSIFHVDVGRREIVKLDVFHRRARHLPPDMESIPAQAVYCSLISLSSVDMKNRIVFFQVELVLAGQVGRLGPQEHTLVVTILREILSFSDHNLSPVLSTKPLKKKHLFNDKKMTKKNKMNGTPQIPVCSGSLFPPPLANRSHENRNRIEVMLTHFISPGHFYVRIISVPPALRQDFHPPEICFEDLSSQLNIHYRSAPVINVELIPGLICVVHFPDSGKFLRCRILDDDNHQIQLIDVGTILRGIKPSQLRLLEDRWSIEVLPAMAFCCSLWGLQPADHNPKWSKHSADFVINLAAKVESLFARVYHVERSILMMRLYYECFNHTGCFNDELMLEGLAVRMPPSSCPVSVRMPEEWPACLNLPPDLEATPVWIDKNGVLYIHQTQEPYPHVEKISRLLHWFYSGSEPDQMELGHWEVGHLCVAENSDGLWYRGRVLAADDGKKLANILFVDFGYEKENVPYEAMRRNLICFDYAIQACGVRMAKYPGPGGSPPTNRELKILRDAFFEKNVRLSVKYSDGDIPLATNVQFVSGIVNLDDFFSRLRPETRQAVPTQRPKRPSSISVYGRNNMWGDMY